MISQEIQKIIIETLIGKESLKNFEKFVYNLSLEEGSQYFGIQNFLKFLEYDYSSDKIDIEFEQLCITLIDVSDFLREYVIFLLEKFLQKNENSTKIQNDLYELYCGGLGFLSIFEDIYYFDDLQYENTPESEQNYAKILSKIPHIIDDVKKGKYYNFDFDDGSDWQKYRILQNSLLIPSKHRFIYQEK